MAFTPQRWPAFVTPSEPDLTVWRIALDASPERTSSAFRLLSVDERTRFNRFKVERARRRFAVARASLRCLLGQIIKTPPESVRFEYGAHGKPRIHPAQNPEDVRFNLSHSGDIALLALTVGREVGVDVERLRDRVPFQKLAARFFAPEEAESLNQLSGPDLRLRFFRIWTAKEAYIKAIGMGLRIPLDQFAFQIGGAPDIALTQTDHDPTQLTRWRFFQFQPDDLSIATIGLERLLES